MISPTRAASPPPLPSFQAVRRSGRESRPTSVAALVLDGHVLDALPAHDRLGQADGVLLLDGLEVAAHHLGHGLVGGAAVLRAPGGRAGFHVCTGRDVRWRVDVRARDPLQRLVLAA